MQNIEPLGSRLLSTSRESPCLYSKKKFEIRGGGIELLDLLELNMSSTKERETLYLGLHLSGAISKACLT